MNGSPVEVEGRLVEGVLVANQVKSEEDDENVRIEAAVVSIDADARTLSIWGSPFPRMVKLRSKTLKTETATSGSTKSNPAIGSKSEVGKRVQPRFLRP